MANGAHKGTAGYGNDSYVKLHCASLHVLTFIAADGLSASHTPTNLSPRLGTSCNRSLHKDSVDPLRYNRYFDPSAAVGSKWSKAAVSDVFRLYHSSATLLLDGSVFVSGSNPNADCKSDCEHSANAV